MKVITKDLCVYCLDKATVIRKTKNYKVGLCDKHKELPDEEIEDIISINKHENLHPSKL